MPLLFFLPQHRMQKRLKQKAMLDYQYARGTIHKTELEQIEQKLLTRLGSLHNDINARISKLEDLRKEKAEKLDRLLSEHLVLNQLNEVNGIGAKLQQEIFRKAYRGHLQDLKYAFDTVQGIGEYRQDLIDAWVDQKIKAFPLYRKLAFSGKSQVVQHYKILRAELNSEIQKLERQEKVYLEHLKQIYYPLKELQRVNEKDFIDAILEPGKNSEKITLYQIGLYPEWEKTPAWYRKLLELDL